MLIKHKQWCGTQCNNLPVVPGIHNGCMRPNESCQQTQHNQRHCAPDNR